MRTRPGRSTTRLTLMIVISGLLLALICRDVPWAVEGGGIQQRVAPSTIAKQLAKEEEKLRGTFERDLVALRAQPEDWEERLQSVVKRAVGLLAEFQFKDWQGEELFALSALYFFAEDWARSLEGFRKFLAEPAENGKDEEWENSRPRADARFRVVRALIELNRVEEAAKALVEVDQVDTSSPALLGARVLLHRDLAIAYRNLGDLPKAARQAIAGFEIGRRISPREIPDQSREVRDFETARLAATAVALLERVDQKKVADDLQRRWRAMARGRSAQAETTYDEELTIQRLIGRPAPEIEARVWIDPPPLTSTALRGKVVLLYFWAMWNTSSTSQFDRLKQWQSEFKERGFEVVGVTRLFGRSEREAGLTATAELKSLEAFRTSAGIGFPFAVAGQDDPTNDERFNAAVLPMLVLIDRQGTIRRIDRGAPVRGYRGLYDEIARLTTLR
ncbi:MAG: TlpA disulfide reductase family protein [Acidobacteriota bacterium]